jgi:colanic acid biosynthesis glycosyl transferase WcaI
VLPADADGSAGPRKLRRCPERIEGGDSGLKIIFVNRFFYPDNSATAQLLTDLAFSLAESGLDVHVVTSRQRYEDPDAILCPVEGVRGVRVHRIWTSRFGRTRLIGRSLDYATFYSGAAWRLLRLAGRRDVIVAKTDPPLISVVAAFVARVTGAQLVNWLQDVFPEVAERLGVRGLEGGLGRLLRRLRDASLRQARTNVALSEGMSAYLVRRGVGHDRMRVIPNWVDDAAIAPIPHERNRMRARWGLADRFVVGYSGNMGRAHEFETILGAIARLKNEPRIVFLFIGGGNQRAYLEEQTKRRALSQARFEPYQPREALAESLGACDVHLISLRPALEGFVVPSKLYGVAAAGRPVVFIGHREGEIARILKEGNCGIVVEPGDSEKLAEGLLALRDDPLLRMEWGRNARRLIDEKYSKRKAMDAWQEALTGRQETVANDSAPS